MFRGAEFRVAARSLLKRPGYSLVPVVTLVVVVAAATAVFSILEGVLLRPLPYPQGDRLYRVFHTSLDRRDAEDPRMPSWDRLAVTRDALRAWSESAEAVEQIGGYVPMWGPWGDDLEVEGAFVLQGFFETLGVEPLMGRLPTPDEVRSSANLLVLSEDLWSTRFGRDPGVLGRTLRYTWTSGTVVGVLPGSFTFPFETTRWWSPVPSDFADGRTDVRQISAVTRLGEGKERATAVEELSTILAGLASENPVHAGLGVRLMPLRDAVVGDVKAGIMQLFWAVFLVVLIASVNLATLVVARTSGRKGELAVRAALGAGRLALVGAVLTEVLVLCAVGGGLGVLAASWLLDPLVGLLSGSFPGFPRLGNVGMNQAVLGFSGAITAGAAVLSGLTPALVWSRRAPWEAMKGAAPSRGGRGTRRGQAGLLLVESSLAVILLVAGGLLVRSVLSSHAVDPGFDAARTAFMEVSFSADEVAGQAELVEAGERLERRLASLSSVTSVGRARTLPTLGGTRRNLVWTPTRGWEGAPVITSVEVSSDYFRTMGIPLLEGRVFGDADGAGAEPVTVVGRQVARIFFGDADPVGQILVFGTGTRTEGDRLVADGGDTLRVVGVVEDVHQQSMVADPEPVLYLPMAQRPIARSQSVVVRTAGDPRDALPELRRAVEQMGAGVAVRRLGELERAIWQPLAPLRVRTLLITVMAGLAGLLILVGIYGVVSHVVSDRIHEIGIRMALGARGAEEAARVMLETLRPVVLGGVLGLGGAVLASGLVEQALYGVDRLDPMTYGTVVALLGVLGGAAAWVPARRAASVDPARVLQEE